MSERPEPNASEKSVNKMDLAESLLDDAINPPKAEKLDIEEQTANEAYDAVEAAETIQDLGEKYGYRGEYFDYAEDGDDTMQISYIRRPGKKPQIVARIVNEGKESDPFPVFTLNTNGGEVETNEGGKMAELSMTAQDIERWSEYFDMQRVLLRGMGEKLGADVHHGRRELINAREAKPEEITELQEMSRIIGDRFPESSPFGEDKLDDILQRRKNLQAAKSHLQELGLNDEDEKGLKQMKAEIDERLAGARKLELNTENINKMDEDVKKFVEKYKELGEIEARYRQMVIDNRTSPQEQHEQREQKFL